MSKTIGTQLEAARSANQLSIEDVAHVTRIHRDVLCQLESDEFSNFPNLMFLKSFLKLYSQHLGVDASETIAKLDADASRHGEQYLLGGIDPLIRERYGNLTSRIPVRPILASVAAIALLAFGGSYLVSQLYASGLNFDSKTAFPSPDLEDLAPNESIAPSEVVVPAPGRIESGSGEPETSLISVPAKQAPRAFPAVPAEAIAQSPSTGEFELSEKAPIDLNSIPKAAPIVRTPESSTPPVTSGTPVDGAQRAVDISTGEE